MQNYYRLCLCALGEEFGDRSWRGMKENLIDNRASQYLASETGRRRMFKVLAFLSKRKDITLQAFIDYYENRHIPLILRLAPTPVLYKRRYFTCHDALTKEGGTVDFDVVTELGFVDRTAFEVWMEHLSRPGVATRFLATRRSSSTGRKPAPTSSRNTSLRSRTEAIRQLSTKSTFSNIFTYQLSRLKRLAFHKHR